MRILTLVAALTACAGVAQAADGRLVDARIERHDEALVFELAFSGEVDGELLEKHLDAKDRVLIMRVGGMKAERRWAKLKDPAVKRALIHPSYERPPAAILRVRFLKKIPPSIFENIRMRADGNTVRFAMPRKPGGEVPDALLAGAAVVAAPVVAPVEAPIEAPPEEPPQEVAVVEPPPEEPPPPVEAAPEPPSPSALADEVMGTSTLHIQADPTDDVRSGMHHLALQVRGPLGDDVARVAVLPFTSPQPNLRRGRYDAVASALLTRHLEHQQSTLQVDPERLEQVVGGLDEPSAPLSDRQAIALGRLLGVSTVVTGTVSQEADQIAVRARTLDTGTGREIAIVDQPFGTTAMSGAALEIVEERTRWEGVWRNLLAPGWGQVHNGDTGRGAAYLSLWGAMLAGAATSVALGAVAESDYSENDPSTVDRRRDADAHYDRANVLFIGLGTAYLASIIDAALTGPTGTRIEPGIYGEAP